MLPMSTVIRLASMSYHYMSVFDHHTGMPLYLGRTKRIATPGQRIVLHAKHRGCTRPGCTVAGADCQVHHAVTEWAQGGQTDIDDLTLACPRDNRTVKPGGWTTRKRHDGRTEWIPHHTSTAGNHGSTTTTTPKATSSMKMTTKQTTDRCCGS